MEYFWFKGLLTGGDLRVPRAKFISFILLEWWIPELYTELFVSIKYNILCVSCNIGRGLFHTFNFFLIMKEIFSCWEEFKTKCGKITWLLIYFTQKKKRAIWRYFKLKILYLKVLVHHNFFYTFNYCSIIQNFYIILYFSYWCGLFN